MIKKIQNWLNKPYQFRDDKPFRIGFPILITCVVFLFLYIVKPFHLHEVGNNLALYFLGYGIIAGLNICLFLELIFPIFPNFFNSNKWTVGREILTLLFVICSCSVWCWLYHHTVAINVYKPENFSYLQFLKYTFNISIFAIVVQVIVVEKFLTSSREQVSNELRTKKIAKSVTATSTLINISTTNGKETISFELNELVFANSQGNYVSFYLKKQQDFQEKILRIQMKKIEEILENHKNIVRCHKSYIVNTNYVKDITGNARGYYLHLKESEEIIPVSRSFSKQELLNLIS